MTDISGPYRTDAQDGPEMLTSDTVTDLVTFVRTERKRLNAKAKGTRNEHRSIAILEAAGYACCRSAASLGCWDIIGVSATDIVLCQVKSNAWPGRDECETLRLFAAPPNARKIIHRWRDGVRLPDVREVP